MSEFVYTAKQVMDIIGVKSYDTLKKMREKGWLKPLNLPIKRILYSKKDVQKFLEGNFDDITKLDNENK